jgi:hypothetical protein
LGDIIHKSVPNGLEKYAKKKLFRPLKLQKYNGSSLKVTNTAGSLQLNSLDYAKFGQLYKNKELGMGNKFYQRMDSENYITPNNNIRG